MQKAKVMTAWVIAMVGSFRSRKVRCMNGPIISGAAGPRT